MPTLPKTTVEDKSARETGFRRWTLLWGAIWIALLLLSPVFPREGSNSESRWALTRAIVERGSFSIDGFEGATHDRAFREGRWYSDKAPGLSLLGVPALLAVRAAETVTGPVPERREFLLVRLLTVTLPSFLVLALVFVWLRRSGSDPFEAGLWPAVWWCATPAFVYGNLLFSHQAAAWLLSGAFLLLRLGREKWWAALLAGLLAGWAITVEYVAVVAVVVALIAHPFAIRRARLASVAGTVLPLMLLGVYNTLCFGAPWRLGYQFQTWPASSATDQGLFGFTALTAKGLTTIFLSPAHGLLFFLPVLLVPLAMVLARPRLPGSGSVPALLFLGYALLFSSYAEPEAGACLGPRHLVPYLPLALWWVSRRVVRGSLSESALLGLALGASLRTALLAGSDILFPYSTPDPFTGYTLPLASAGVITGNLLGVATVVPVTLAVPLIGLLLPALLARGRRIALPLGIALLFLALSPLAERLVAPEDPRPAAFDRAFTLRTLGRGAEALTQIAPHLASRSLTPTQETLALEILGEEDPAAALELARRLPDAAGGERAPRLAAVGAAAWRLGDAATAAEAFRGALAAGGRTPETYLNLALATERQGGAGEALAVALEGIRVNPGHPGLLLRAGRLALELGREGEGRALLAEAVRLDPEQPGAQQVRRLLERGR